MPLHKFNNPGLVYYKALSKYLELVKDIPEVVEVRLSEEDQLYAIISGPQEDEAVCYQVYGVEDQVMKAVRPQPFLFRLVNINRLPFEGRETHVKSFGELVWKR